MSNPNRFGALALALALTAVGGSALAETRHVSTAGNDTNPGTVAAPYRTIQRAADAVAPGDTVVVHAGTYPGFVVARSGTQAAPIAFVGDGAVTIDGALTANRDAIAIEGADWIRIEAMTVVRATRAGIAALDCSHVTVRGNKVDANGRWGVFSSFCEDLVVEGNELSRSGTEHGVYASNSADRPIIRNNRIWGNAACGVHMNGDIFVPGGDGIISGAIVEGNVIYDNGRLGGSAINGDGIVNAIIRNNVLDNNHASGISLYRIDGGAPSTGNQVINNTVRMAADGRWAVNIQDGSTGNVLRNNILLHLSPNRGAIDICATCVAAMQSDNNAVTGRFSLGGTIVDLAAWRAQTGNDAASFTAVPDELFAAAASGDLTLKAGSLALDKGVATNAPATDVVGTMRPQGAAFDLGAYERCPSQCTTDDGSGSGSGSGSGAGSGSDGSTSEDGTAPGEPLDAPDDTVAGGCATTTGSSAGLIVLLGLLRRRGRRAQRQR